jgi:hypothetical protein
VISAHAEDDWDDYGCDDEGRDYEGRADGLAHVGIVPDPETDGQLVEEAPALAGRDCRCDALVHLEA